MLKQTQKAREMGGHRGDAALKSLTPRELAVLLRRHLNVRVASWHHMSISLYTCTDSPTAHRRSEAHGNRLCFRRCAHGSVVCHDAQHSCALGEREPGEEVAAIIVTSHVVFS